MAHCPTRQGLGGPQPHLGDALKGTFLGHSVYSHGLSQESNSLYSQKMNGEREKKR